MKKINVNLYGGKGIFGGRESPLEADEIYCDKSDVCSFCNEGKCLRCRSFLSGINCKFGRTTTTQGYTSRAKKYSEFKNKYQNDEQYSKLKYPDNLVATIGDILFIKTKYVNIKKIDDIEHYTGCRSELINGYELSSSHFANSHIFIPISDVTNELLYGILTYEPRTLFSGGRIKDYDDVVNDILVGLKKFIPWMYKDFIKAYPDMNREPNYIGKYAYISSLKPGTKFRFRCYDWVYDGTYVTTHNFDTGIQSPWITENRVSEEVKFKVTDKMVIEVEDNSIVDDDTVFA